MHRFVTSSIFFVATSLIACSGGHSTPNPGSSEGALAEDAGKGGGDPDPGGGKGGGCGGGGDACFTQAIDACLDYGQLKQLVADKCGVPGLVITQIDFGPSCGDNKAAGVKYTCCAAPPPPPKCQDFPIPPEICKDLVAVKDYVAKVCAGGSGTLNTDDPCSPKAAVECCAEPPPPPPPPKCQDFPIPPDVCKDATTLKEYAVKVCAGGAPNFILPDGDPCGPKSAVECCYGDPTPPPPQK